MGECMYIDHAWSRDDRRVLDRPKLAAIAGRDLDIVFATVSGAHLYGFASPDSDVDLRGAFVLPIEAMIGLSQPTETVTIEETEEGIELDFVAHDIRKFARMMLRHNGYVLEQLFSPLVVSGGAALEELREIGRGCITRGLFRHYRGFAHSRRRLLAGPHPTVKHLLYAYRVYLTGIHVLQEGRIECHIESLNEKFKLPKIEDLVDRKRTTAEKTPLDADEIPAHEKELDRLDACLAAAHERSGLPEEPATQTALNDFVVNLRLSGKQA